MDRPRYQDNPRASGGGGLGHGVSHLAAGAIGDVTNRVEWFLGGPSRNQHGLPFEVAAFPRDALDRPGDGFRLRQAPRASHAACEVTRTRLDNVVAALAQRFQV